jgi:hypothetical protein
MLIKTPREKIIVIYHGRCPDGFGGAWAAWKKLGAKAAYLPALDRNGPPCNLEGKEVYIIDYPYQLPVIKKIAESARRLIIIDHHKDQGPAMRLADSHSYDMKHSGAVLAWNYFHPGKKVPMLLRYVEDRDLWAWKVPHSLDMLMLVDLEPYDFKIWNRLVKEFEDPRRHTSKLKDGILLNRYYHSLYKKLIPNAEAATFAGKKVFVLNCPYYFADDLGHVLAKKTHTFGVLWNETGGRIRVSLRSYGKIDVAKIAEKHGGGGHKYSAGFSFPVTQKSPWKLLPQAFKKERIS